jgi:hypothetical protein
VFLGALEIPVTRGLAVRHSRKSVKLQEFCKKGEGHDISKSLPAR